MTGNVSPIRHLYKVQRELKTYTIFELEYCKNQTEPTPPVLTDLIRIETFRNYSKGQGFEKYLRIRNVSNWSKCDLITGLFKTESKYLFWGDRLHEGRKHLLVFQYFFDEAQLIIDYYPNLNPHTCDLRELINTYIQVIQKDKRA